MRRFLLIAGLGLAVAFTATIAYLHSQSFQHRVEAYVIAQIEAGSGTRVTLSGFQLQIWPPRLALDGLIAHGREAAGQPPLAAIPRVTVVLRRAPLLHGRIAFEQITVEHPIFRVYVLPDHLSNLPLPTAPWQRRQDEATGLFALGTEHLDVTGGELDLADRRIPLALHLQALALNAAPAAGTAPGLTGQVNFRAPGLQLGSLPGLEASANLTFRLGPRGLEIPAAELTAPGLQATGAAQLADFSRPAPTGTYTLQIEAGAVSQALHVAPAFAGDIRLTGVWSWTPASWQTTGQAAASHIRRLGAERALGDWSGSGTFQAGSRGFDLPDLKLTGLGASVTLQLSSQDWRRVQLAGNASGLQLSNAVPVLRWAGLSRDWTTLLNGFGAHLSGTFDWRGAPLGYAERPAYARPAGNPREPQPAERIGANWRARSVPPPALSMQLHFAPAPSATREALGGDLDLASSSPNNVTVRQLSLQTNGAALTLSGQVAGAATSLAATLTVADLSVSAPLLRRVAAVVAPGSALPQLAGSLQFAGQLQGPPTQPTLSGRAEWDHARLAGQARPAFAGGFAPALPLVASPRPLRDGSSMDFNLTVQGSLSATQLLIAPASVQIGAQELIAQGTVGLTGYRLTPASVLALTLTGRNIQLAQLQTLWGLDYALGGTLAANARVSGTWSDPQGAAAVHLRNGHWRTQPFSALDADFQFRDQQLSTSDLALTLRRTVINGGASLGLRDHSYRLDLTSPGVRLQDIALLQAPQLAVSGAIRFQLQGQGNWDHPQATLIFTGSGLQGGGETLGDASGKLQLANNQVAFQAADILPNGSFNLSGTAATAAPYQVDAKLNLKDYDFDVWLRRFTPADITGHSHASGTAEVHGPLADPSRLTARVQFDRIEVAVSGLDLHNQAPVTLSANARRVTLTPVHLTAEDTDLALSGGARLGATLENPVQLALRAQGNVNLALLHSFVPDLASTGQLNLSVSLTGPWSAPQVNGTADVAQASFAERNLPIALDNVAGHLQLSGRRLQIVTLTASTGSGSLSLGGYLLAAPGGLQFDLNAQGQDLRLRYRGVSATGNLQLRFNGQRGSALLAGNVQLNRIGLDPNFDLAVILAASQSIASPASPDSLLNGVRLNVHLVTGPQVEVATNMARVPLQADLQLRGTLAAPAILGRASASEGRVLFAGNEYNLTKAQVLFISPFRIEPQLDIALSTTVQPYDVTLNLSGPPDKLAITYRSDPPLSNADVVALLATGTPTQASAALTQTGTAASFTGQSAQMLSQALSDLASSRLQRLFGITQIRVNPNTGALGPTGNGGSVTVQQQVSRNLKLTYTQNLASTSQDIIEVDWTISRFLGIQLSRDQFGLYGLQFIFRHRAR